MAPLLAFGHACEFLVAKLEVKDGVVQLEITADYGANPMLADEAAANEAVQRILQLRVKDQTEPLQELAPLIFEHRKQWDPATPASFSPPPDGQEHQLLTGIWRWQPEAKEIALSVPKGCPNDVLLWTTAEHLPGKQVQWMLLIEGESTPVIHMPQSGVSRKPWWLPIGVLVALSLIGWLWLIKRRQIPFRMS